MSKGKHINQFELFVLWKTVELWGKHISKKNNLIYCDNKPTVDCLKSGMSRNIFSQTCIRNIMYFAAINDFQIQAVHISGCTNHISDCLSRWNQDVKFRDEFHRLISGTKTVEIKVTDTKFADLY